MENAIAAHHSTAEYDTFVLGLNARFNALPGPLFETDATGLYEIYLASFPEGAERQFHTCSHCRAFVERFGGLATVNADGTLEPVMWEAEGAPQEYVVAMASLSRMVRKARVTRPFLTSELRLGVAMNVAKDGTVYTHFAVEPRGTRLYKASPLKNAHQAAAEKVQEFASVMQALQEYLAAAVDTALRILKGSHVQNSDAELGQAQFLADLHNTKNRNLRWKFIAEAPAGFCHPRSSMIATLLDDIVAGVSFEVAREKWNRKMHPLQFRRPQAAPTEGAVKAAEEAFAKLGAGPALRRRYATMADILTSVWVPKFAEAPAPAATLFGGIKTKEAAAAPAGMKLPPVTMTWTRFEAEVLPQAEKIEALQPAMDRQHYATLVTADVADARPILQWDTEEFPNPVSMFVYHEGSLPREFMLAPGFVTVKLITRMPHQWRERADFPHLGEGVLLVLEGARDTGKAQNQSGIFPNMLKSELHPFSSVVEAYSKSNPLLGWEAEHVAGQMVVKGGSCNLVLRVNVGGVESDYRIDRWE